MKAEELAKVTLEVVARCGTHHAIRLALKQYGAEIRRRDAEICRALKIKMEFDSNAMPLAEKWHNVACNDCAQAIEREELP